MSSRSIDRSINRLFIFKIILIILFIFAILEQLSMIYFALGLMRISGDPLPLQLLLSNFEFLWGFVDNFWSAIIGFTLFDALFRQYGWGGATFASIFWLLKSYLDKIGLQLENSLSEKQKRGQYLSLVFSLIFLAMNIYGIGKDRWIIYVHDSGWRVNMLHKQQLSGGSYMIIFIVFFSVAGLPNMRIHQGVKYLLESQKIMIYAFVWMFFETLASFSFFNGGFDTVFGEDQNWTSFDKLIHFSMSSVLTVLLLIIVKRGNTAVKFAFLWNIFWELFEISLHPIEATDSLLDMILNSLAIGGTYIVYNKYAIPYQDQLALLNDPHITSS